MPQVTHCSSPSPYETGRQSIRLWDGHAAAEGIDVANQFAQEFGDDAVAMAEFSRGVADEKRLRGLVQEMP